MADLTIQFKQVHRDFLFRFKSEKTSRSVPSYWLPLIERLSARFSKQFAEDDNVVAWGEEVEFFEQDGDNIIKDLVTLRLRFTLVYKPFSERALLASDQIIQSALTN